MDNISFKDKNIPYLYLNTKSAFINLHSNINIKNIKNQLTWGHDSFNRKFIIIRLKQNNNDFIQIFHKRWGPGAEPHMNDWVCGVNKYKDKTIIAREKQDSWNNLALNDCQIHFLSKIINKIITNQKFNVLDILNEIDTNIKFQYLYSLDLHKLIDIKKNFVNSTSWIIIGNKLYIYHFLEKTHLADLPISKIINYLSTMIKLL